MKDSKIEWCDHTFNPWIGCTKVSPGCANCYAEEMDRRRFSKTLGTGSHWGPGAPRHRTSAANWKQPLKWDREAAPFRYGGRRPEREMEAFGWRPHRPRVFCASLADWLDEEVPVAWLAALLDLIRCTPHLNWLLLTKRPQSWRSRMEAVVAMEVAGGPSGADQCYGIALAAAWLNGMRPDNVWVGTTVEDQPRADERIPHLLRIPARVRFLSCEPLLEGLVLRDACFNPSWSGPRIHWVITGGESGPKARPSHPDWFRSLRDQCKAAGVPFLFKQWGEWIGARFDSRKGKVICDSTVAGEVGRVFWTNPGHPELKLWDAADHYWTHVSARVGKSAAGRLLDGIEHNEFPNP